MGLLQVLVHAPAQLIIWCEVPYDLNEPEVRLHEIFDVVTAKSPATFARFRFQ